ncbi:MAG TPA: M28 family peptidase, partial [Chitinophagaceae bacterium]|nr:M28 family peptidase [Chitinophagaceae bacterium]
MTHAALRGTLRVLKVLISPDAPCVPCVKFNIMIFSTRKLILMMAALLVVQPLLYGQGSNDAITENEVERIIHFLAADSLKGRGNGRSELLYAGKFIGEEFKKNGLKPFSNNAGYYMPFRPFGGSKKFATDALVWNGKKMSTDEFIYIHPEPGNYATKKLSDFTIIKIDSFFTEDILEQYSQIKTDLLLWSNRPQPDNENYFPPRIKMPVGATDRNILMVCAVSPPDSILLSGVKNYYENVGYNIVGMLPGRSKPDEIILFSAHYDHEGVYQRGRKRDSIMNGANDN